MRADLRFEDASLERQFAELQASRGRKLGKQVRADPCCAEPPTTSGMPGGCSPTPLLER